MSTLGRLVLYLQWYMLCHCLPPPLHFVPGWIPNLARKLKSWATCSSNLTFKNPCFLKKHKRHLCVYKVQNITTWPELLYNVSQAFRMESQVRQHHSDKAAVTLLIFLSYLSSFIFFLIIFLCEVNILVMSSKLCLWLKCCGLSQMSKMAATHAWLTLCRDSDVVVTSLPPCHNPPLCLAPAQI